MYFIAGVVVGVFAGWAVPQPVWAKNLWDGVVAKAKALTAKRGE